MKLYRYIPALNRKDESELYSGMLENLREARLKFAHPADLNDPLEAIIPYKFIEHGKTVTPDLDKMKEMLGKYLGIANWNAPRGKRILEALPFGMTLEYALMLSMSKAKNHPLMWAHYADNHRGVCLEFDFPDEFLNEVKWSKEVVFHEKRFGLSPTSGEVNYERSRVPITFRDGISENDYCIGNALLSKPKCWEYEREYRVLLCYPWASECRFAAGIETGEFYFEYPRAWLTGITFGMRLSDYFRKKIATCIYNAGYQNVAWEEEKLANDMFEITSEAIDI